jgi:hypothetical protein
MVKRNSSRLCAKKPGRRTMFLESLESRAMLAGDISVNVSGGNLIVRGNNADNQVAILKLDTGEYAVAGFNGTTVKGSANPYIAKGVTGNIDVDLKSGNDLLGVGNDVAGLIALGQALGFGAAIGDAAALQTQLETLLADAGAPARLNVPRNLIVRAGGGRDGVGISGDIGRDINADLGSGNNTLAIVNSRVGDDVIARAGGQNDLVLIQESKIDEMLDVHLGHGTNDLDVADSSIGQSAIVISGKNNDFVHFADVSIDDNVIVRTSSGADEVYVHSHDGVGIDIGGNVDIDTGSNADFVEVGEGSVGGSVNIRTGDHIDEVNLLDLQVRRNVIVLLGSGNDFLFADNVRVRGVATIDAGSGDDEVVLVNSDVDKVLTAVLGSGRDRLSIFASSADLAVLIGGSDFDTLNGDDEDFADDAVVVLFEDVNVIV